MLNDDDPPPSLHGHYPTSSLLRSSPPLSGASVLSASRLEPLAPFPLASPCRFSRSIQEPGRGSRRLHAGCHLGSLRHPPSLSRRMGQPSVLTSSKQISTLLQQFAYARLSQPCLTGSCPDFSATFTTMACMGSLLSSGFRAAISLSCFLDRFLCSIWNPRFFAPTRSIAKPTRAGAVKVGRRTNLSAPSALARPYLDSCEHGGTLDAVGMTIRGEPAFGRADQSRHILVFGGSKGSEP